MSNCGLFSQSSVCNVKLLLLHKGQTQKWNSKYFLKCHIKWPEGLVTTELTSAGGMDLLKYDRFHSKSGLMHLHDGFATC